MRLTTETFARRRTPLPRTTTRPMPLPMLPDLKNKEEERRRSAVAFPAAPGAAPVQVAVVGTTSGSPVLWLARTFLRTMLRNGLPSGTLPAVAVVFAGLTLGFAYGGLVHEAESPAMSAAFIPHPPASGSPIPTQAPAPSSFKMVVEEPLNGPVPTPAAAAAPEPAAPAFEAAGEVSAPAAPVVDGPLNDALGSLKPHRVPRGERLGWNGQGLQASSPLGGDFRPLRGSKAAAAAAKARVARRAAKGAALRGSARLKLGTSRLQGGSASRAMGQLKLANRLSAASAQAPSVETARQAGTDAFEQGKTVGGAGLALDAVPSTGLGSSAPDVTEPGAPALPAGENVTPYQDKVDSAKQKNSMTIILLVIGAMLIAAGIGLLVIASEVAALQPELAATLETVGYSLLAAGAAALLMGFLMSQGAKDDGKAVSDQYGQEDQGAVIEDCADQSLGKADCAPKAVEQPGNTVHESVEAESNAGYTLGAEGAQGGTN